MKMSVGKQERIKSSMTKESIIPNIILNYLFIYTLLNDLRVVIVGRIVMEMEKSREMKFKR